MVLDEVPQARWRFCPAVAGGCCSSRQAFLQGSYKDSSHYMKEEWLLWSQTEQDTLDEIPEERIGVGLPILNRMHFILAKARLEATYIRCYFRLLQPNPEDYNVPVDLSLCFYYFN